MGRSRLIFCYVMVAPAVLLVLTLTVYPMLESLRMSFLQYDLMRINVDGTPFVGLENFKTVFTDRRFTISLINTFLFAVIVVSIGLFLGLMIAQLLNMAFRGRGILRSMILIPWVTPPVVAATVWVWMYQPERSPFNQVLRALGLIQTEHSLSQRPDHVSGRHQYPHAGRIQRARVEWPALCHPDDPGRPAVDPARAV